MKQKFNPARNIFLAFSLSVACTMPVMAQSTTGSATGASAGTSGTTTTQATSDNTSREQDRDYGWLGLLGLAGLLGLRRKPDVHPVTRTSNTTAR